MLQDTEMDAKNGQPELEMDPPVAKAAALTGALVQRGRDRAPRVHEARADGGAFDTTLEPPALVAEAPLKVELAAPRSSRWADALFVAACCAAFFASFLFVLRF